MLLNEWASLAIICILGAFSPGPSLMVILSLTASDGRKSGYIASIGHGIGIFVYALLSATGLAIALNTYRQLFIAIQILGVIFLFFLGIQIFRSSFSTSTKVENVSQKPARNFFSNAFLDGFLIAMLNPKIGVFFLSLFSQFLVVGQTFATHLGMATLAGVIDTFAYLMMVSLASTCIMFKFFNTYKKSIEFSFGFILLVLSISLCFKLSIEYL